MSDDPDDIEQWDGTRVYVSREIVEQSRPVADFLVYLAGLCEGLDEPQVVIDRPWGEPGFSCVEGWRESTQQEQDRAQQRREYIENLERERYEVLKSRFEGGESVS